MSESPLVVHIQRPYATVEEYLEAEAWTIETRSMLLIDAEGLFALLLGDSAVVPATVTPILLVLLTAGVIKTAPAFLLEHTGYFKEIAWLSVANVLLMTAGIGIGLLVHLDGARDREVDAPVEGVVHDRGVAPGRQRQQERAPPAPLSRRSPHRGSSPPSSRR